MTLAAQALAAHRRLIARVGETVTFRRYTSEGAPRSKTDVTAKARVMDFQPDQLVGPIVKGDRLVIALVDDLASLLPITTNDRLVVRGRELAIKAVDDNTRRIGGTLVALELRVSG